MIEAQPVVCDFDNLPSARFDLGVAHVDFAKVTLQ
jgi:hypothetical protein